MERLAQAAPPAPAPTQGEEASDVPDQPGGPDVTSETPRAVISLVPDPPDRIFDQDDLASQDSGHHEVTEESLAEVAPIRGTVETGEEPEAATSPAEAPTGTELAGSGEPEDRREPVEPEAASEESEIDGVVSELDEDAQPAQDEEMVEDDADVDTEALEDRDGEGVGPAPVPRSIPTAGLSEGPILDPESLPEAAAVETAPFELPRVIAIANQKGGVGKTTTAVNLGAALAELEFRVLVLDLDPQGNATTGLGINPRDVEGSVYDVLLNDVALEDIVEPTTLRNLFVAPATIDLAGAEIELVPTMSRELRLKRAIDQVRPDYDLVLIDCPPSLGLLTVNGLAAADDVIVPIQCEYYALEGLGQLLRNVGLVQANLNQSLDVRGIILTMYDARTKLADQVESEVRNYFGPKVYRTVVPRTVRLSEAPSFGQPIIVFDSTSRGASAYRELAKEVSRGASKRAR
jgi:chromosome partitioning protein